MSQVAILGYKNAQVVRRHAKEKNVSLAEAKRHFRETLKFLHLCGTSHAVCTPSRPIDEVWHTFVLFTQDYRKFCLDQFGFFIHHVPADGPMVSAYQETRALAQKTFGRLDPKMWPKKASEAGDDCCSPCGCASCGSCNTAADKKKAN